MTEAKLPQIIQAQLDEADSMLDRLDGFAQMHPKVGRPPNTKSYHQKLSVVVADDEKTLEILIGRISSVLGPRGRGNKRHALKALYSDLTPYFLLMDKAGISLPRKHLNLDFCSDHLAEILHRHNYLSKDEMESGAIYTQATREYLSNSLGRVFARITDTITPCNNP